MLPAVIHLVRLSEGKELPRFQHFRSTKTIKVIKLFMLNAIDHENYQAHKCYKFSFLKEGLPS